MPSNYSCLPLPGSLASFNRPRANVSKDKHDCIVTTDYPSSLIIFIISLIGFAPSIELGE